MVYELLKKNVTVIWFDEKKLLQFFRKNSVKSMSYLLLKNVIVNWFDEKKLPQLFCKHFVKLTVY